ncbi:virulence factor Mce family protein [Mycolicibacterium rhodesiae JS60]|nr:virulence factor Mce family protein [Mycolicibacterium rhodesiae JS60]
MTTLFRRAAALSSVVAVTVMLAGCEWRGANSLPVPGTEGKGSGAFEVQAQLPDVLNIEQNSRVRVGDVTVGSVRKIERQGWHALVTMRLNGNVELPENATATVGQTSLLGTLHIELAAPKDAKPVGRLHQGSLIPLEHAGAYPTTEQTLASVSALLNGGGLGQIQDITDAFSTAFAGRDHDLRGLIDQVNTFTTHLNNQRDDIIRANESFNRLVGQFAAQKPVLDKALETFPQGINALNRNKDQLAEATMTIGRFLAILADMANRSSDAFVRELKQLAPTVEALANAGPSLTRSLSGLLTYPWPKETIANWVRGDYANLTAIIDLTLSRIDSSMFTGTRWEGDLTELEMQWGRTIGVMPSPYTAGNPLIAPYHLDQGP